MSRAYSNGQTEEDTEMLFGFHKKYEALIEERCESHLSSHPSLSEEEKWSNNEACRTQLKCLIRNPIDLSECCQLIVKSHYVNKYTYTVGIS